MNCGGPEISLAILGFALAMPRSGISQDALRSLVAGDQARQFRNAGGAVQGDRLRVGPAEVGIGLSYSLEWNDNVENVGTGQTWDLIHRPQLSLDLAWPPTKDSQLSLVASLGYAVYTRNPSLDRFYLAPNELAWDLPVKDLLFTLYDRFSFVQDVLSEPALSGTAQFPRFDNTAGIRASWEPNNWFLQAGYGHQNFFSSEYEYLNRASELFFARAGRQLAAFTRGGLEASAALTRYDLDTQSDNDSLSAGPYLEWQLTQAINLAIRGGYVFYAFEGSAAAGPPHDVNSYYGSLDARHQLTRDISHGLVVSHGIQQAFNQGAQYDENTRVAYHAAWAFCSYASLSGDVFYSRGKEPLPDGMNDYEQYGLGVGAGYQVTPKLPLTLTYRHTTRNSNQAGGDYGVNQIILNAQYWF